MVDLHIVWYAYSKKNYIYMMQYTYQRVVQRQILANFRDLYSDGENL